MKAIQLVQNELSKSYRDVNFEVGDTVKVHYRIIEGDKERIQVYEGIVIAIDNKGISKTFTVRRISYDVGVERIFPLHSPRIEKITVVRKGKKRRAKLYFLRERTGKSAKLKEVRSRKKTIETPATHEVVDNSENTEPNA
ncbi:MAG: 50S ribosomal protein L19 [Spirochaetota bacterium]|nr:50S ribosomal protein L19 [Spirochaetota bacterium]